MLRLNVGCGGQYLEGYVNIDIDLNVRADVYADVCDHLPYRDDSVFEIRCWDTLEHISDKGVYEMERVLAPGHVLDVRVPYYANSVAFNDFYHVHYFNAVTLFNPPFTGFTVEGLWFRYSFFKGCFEFNVPRQLEKIRSILCPGILPPNSVRALLSKKFV